MNPIIFNFLEKLAKNNNKEWFSAHKSEYEEAKSAVEPFFRAIYNEISTKDQLGDLKIYRIYRDVRFSKDKTPYKTHFGLYFPRKQPHFRGGYYIHISPEETFVAGGFYAPEKDDLFRIRKEIEMEGEYFSEIMQSENIKKYFGSTLWGDELKSAPKDFDKNDPMIAYIRKKQFILKRDFSREMVENPQFFDEIIVSLLALRPFFDFMTTALTTDLNGESIFS